MEKIKRQKLTPQQKARRKEFTHQFYKNNRFMLALAVLSQMVLAASDLIVSEALRVLADAASERSWELIQRGLWLFVISAAVSFFGGLYNTWTQNRYGQRAINQYKEFVFSKILNKSISSFGREESGRYISALTNDLSQIETNYVRQTTSLVYYVIVFFGALVMLFTYQWKLALITICLCVLPVASSLAFSGKMQSAEQRVSARNEGFVGTVKDLLSGFAVIKSFKAEKEVAREFCKKSEALEADKRYRYRTDNLVRLIGGVFSGSVQLGIFVIAGIFAIRGETTVGVAIAYVQLLNYVLGPINIVPRFIVSRRAAGALMDKLADACAENEQRGGTKVLKNIGSGIRFDGVTFGYDPSEPVLNDLSVNFETGKSYAIVGASGSGKSTLLNLILGYRDDYSGEIHIDGEELREVSTDSLYDMVSTIQQNVFVFNSSIEDNITMFKDFPPELVAHAAQQASLDKLIAEKGHDYACGENGAGLSGGERQRISIARSLVRGAPVLLMDEATSALDAKTAHAVEEQILSIDGLTRLIVTHRLERPLLERYDEIVVLSGGRVVEQGSFDDLMARSGHFAALYSVAQG